MDVADFELDVALVELVLVEGVELDVVLDIDLVLVAEVADGVELGVVLVELVLVDGDCVDEVVLAVVGLDVVDELVVVTVVEVDDKLVLVVGDCVEVVDLELIVVTPVGVDEELVVGVCAEVVELGLDVAAGIEDVVLAEVFFGGLGVCGGGACLGFKVVVIGIEVADDVEIDVVPVLDLWGPERQGELWHPLYFVPIMEAESLSAFRGQENSRFRIRRRNL